MTTTECPLCNSMTTKLHLGDPKDREYFVTREVNSAFYNRCQDCRSLYQIPWPSIEETNTFYHANYQNYEKSKAPFISDFFLWLQRRNSKSFVNHVGKESLVLDFGCNQGQFLKLLAAEGCENLYGFDVVSLENHDNKDSGFTVM